MKQYSIAQARNHFTALVHDVEHTTGVELTRRGEPVAVLISIQEYQRLASTGVEFWDAYQQFKQGYDLQTLNIETGLFADVRDTSPGREVNW